MNNTDIATSYGWRDQPDGRGTWDILKTCGGTIVLLCWSSVCPNIPTLGDGHSHPPKHCKTLITKVRRHFQKGFQHKLQLFLLAILGPDFIFVVAVGQLQAARDAQKKFEDAQLERPSLRHCFFVNMGGFHIKFSGAPGHRSFPVNTEQLLFLVKSGYIDIPAHSELEEAISDRDKADGVARAITILQVVWFSINTIGRASQGLALTTLELTTMAFIFLMLATSICWWCKPMNVTSPIILDSKVDFETMLTRAKASSNEPQLAYKGTPLSFFGRDEWFVSRHWYHYTELLCRLRLASRPAPPYELDYFPSIEYPRITLKTEFILGPLILGYGSVFMIAWNFHFPTNQEQLLWRIAAMICLVYGFLGGIIALLDQHGDTVTSRISTLFDYNKDSHIPQSEKPRSPSTRVYHYMDRISERLRNISPDGDPMMRIRFRILLPTSLLCFAYILSRAYVLIEDLISLRELPESAFATPSWGQYSPLL